MGLEKSSCAPSKTSKRSLECAVRFHPDLRRKSASSGIKEKLVEVAHKQPRYGYRRLAILLGRKGEKMNHKRLFRVYRAAGLSVKRERRKRLMRVGHPARRSGRIPALPYPPAR